MEESTMKFINGFARGRNVVLGLAVASMTITSSIALAQEAADATDEVVVTGIRKALENSVDLKRNSKGIVDSISAEDMGKFPDSNLAESLQRVTGVSIDRDQTSGEGKTVTVRGFGADYNLVTLNGRLMPTSTLGNFGGAPSTRSYDFGNLASEAVSRVDIFKTSKASSESGGMGATIDIRTTRPLDSPGFNASVGLKSVNNQSSDESPTTELSAIIYNTWFDDRIGLSLTAIDQKMDHTVASWRGRWSAFEDIADGLPVNDEPNDTINGVAGPSFTGLPDGTLLAYPRESSGYYISDLEQDRTNFQLTFQARLADNVTFTYDRSSSELEHLVNERSNTVYLNEYVDVPWAGGNPSMPGCWYNPGSDPCWDRVNNQALKGGKSNSVYGTEGNPASIQSYLFTNTTEAWPYHGNQASDFIDYNGTIVFQNNITEVDTDGFNLEWDVNERLSLEFDASWGRSESKPVSQYGSNAYVNTFSKVNHMANLDYTGDIPVLTMMGDGCSEPYGQPQYQPCVAMYQEEGASDRYGNNINYSALQAEGDVIFPGHRAIGDATNAYAYSENQLDQKQIKGVYDFADSDFSIVADTVRFGVSEVQNIVKAGSKSINAGTAGNFPYQYDTFLENYAYTQGLAEFFSSAIEPMQNYFSDFSVAGDLPIGILNIPYETLFALHQDHYVEGGSTGKAICGDNTLQGCLSAPYTTKQVLEEETYSAYLQFEKDFSLLEMPASLVFGVRYEETEVTSKNWKPTYSPYTQRISNDFVKAIETGSSSFFETKGEYDYVLPSVDLDVDVADDFKVRVSYSETISRHPYDKLAGGVTINQDINFAKQGPFEFTGGGSEGNPGLEPFESENFDFSSEWYYGLSSYLSLGYFSKQTENWVGSANKYENVQGIRHAGFNAADGSETGAAIGDLATDANELVTFNVAYNAPSNRSEKIDGFELALQHDFSDYNPLPIDLTGFGFIANATFVNSDADYDNTSPNSENDGQFAILGISDSANFIAYYERYGFSTRLAYNWRESHLVYMGASSAYMPSYEQVDVNVSYEIPGTNLSLSYDGINLNEEGREVYERNNPSYKTWVSQGDAKHIVGVRWKY
jgi:TonB-dependent receptor